MSLVNVYRADDNIGTGAVLVSTLVGNKYTVQAGDVGKYLRYGVTPEAQVGATPGYESFSDWEGPVNTTEFEIRSSGGWLFNVSGTDGFSITGLSSLTSFSYTCIVIPKYDTNYLSTAQRLLSITNAAGDVSFFIALGGSTSALTNEYLTIAKGVVRSGIQSTSDILLAGTPYFIAICSDGSGTTMYINAVSQTVTAGSGGGFTGGISGITGLDRFGLSASFNNNTIANEFYGIQKEVAIWNVKLTSTQVTDIYNNYVSAGGLAATVYSLTSFADYANVVRYYKRNDLIDASNNLAVDTKNPTQKLHWMPFASWDMTQLSGTYNTLPSGIGFQNTKIWQTTTANDKACNHYSNLFENPNNNILYCSFFTANTDEHQSGQWIRWSRSTDFGVTWDTPTDLFPSMDDPNVLLSTRDGIFVHTSHFCVINTNEVWAVADVAKEDSLQLPGTPYQVGMLARRVFDDGSLGSIHWCWIYNGITTPPTPAVGYPSYPYDATNYAALKTYFTTENKRSSFHATGSIEFQGRIVKASGAYNYFGELIEQSEVRLPYGSNFKIWRELSPGTNFYWIQYSRDGITFTVPKISNIPYPVSLGSMVRVGANKIVLVGNPQNTGANIREPLVIAICGPDLQFKPQNVYTVVASGFSNRFNGASKLGRLSYPNVKMLSNGKVGISYTTYGKEDIEFCSFILPNNIN